MNHRLTSAVLFVFLCLMGLWLSSRKPLWTDEIHTQVYTIDRLSYQEILLYRYSPEGNRCPLFYLIQKGVSDLFSYQFPVPWDKRWNFYHPYSQFILRLPAVVYMSGAVALIFFYFSKYYSIRTGVVSLAAVFISPMVWEHWAEARHYALWFLLTVLQTYYFLKILLQNERTKANWLKLTAVHVLLAFTVIFSSLQIIVISFLLWRGFLKQLKPYILLTLAPVLICIFYFFQSTTMYPFWIDYVSESYDEGTNDMRVLIANIPQIGGSFPVEFLFFFIMLTAAMLGFRQQQHENKRRAMYLIWWILLTLLSGILLLLSFFITTRIDSFLPRRYFIFLAPAAIFAGTYCYIYLKKELRRNRWMYVNVMIIFWGLVILRAFRTYMHIHALGIY